MVRKRVLVPLIVAADLLAMAAGAMWFVRFAFGQPCPEPEAHVDDPSARNNGGEDVICVHVLHAVALFVLGLATGAASYLCYFLFADKDDEGEGEAAGDAKKAGYVAIRDDCAGGKHD